MSLKLIPGFGKSATEKAESLRADAEELRKESEAPAATAKEILGPMLKDIMDQMAAGGQAVAEQYARTLALTKDIVSSEEERARLAKFGSALTIESLKNLASELNKSAPEEKSAGSVAPAGLGGAPAFVGSFAGALSLICGGSYNAVMAGEARKQTGLLEQIAANTPPKPEKTKPRRPMVATEEVFT